MLDLKAFLSEIQHDLRKLQDGDKISGDGHDLLHQRIDALRAKLLAIDALIEQPVEPIETRPQ